MSDINFSLPGSETVTLTGQNIDKLIRAGDGDAALLYLYLLRTQGKNTSSEAAIALDKNKGWIASAMAMLSRLGLINLDDKTGMGARPEDAAPDTAKTTKSEEPRKYTQEEVLHEIVTGSDFTVVVEETQRRLGKQLAEDDLLRLFGIYDYLRLPPDVILLLITHCISESRITGDGRAPSIRYIEKAAFTWEREGLFTIEKAEEYLKNLESKKSARGKIKKAMQIKGREFAATESKFVDSWIKMGFEPEAIAIAYDRTIVRTGQYRIEYMDSIISNWHRKGLHTAQQIQDNDSGTRKGVADASAFISTRKHGAPNRREIERMTGILNKIKED